LTDRLRRLDALFATKVLGHTITEMQCKSLHTETWDRLPFITVGGLPLELPRYTRSLDAALAGIPRASATFLTGPAITRIRVVEGEECAVEMRSPCGRWGVKASAPHPAEALVIAALRAVGCSEEELK